MRAVTLGSFYIHRIGPYTKPDKSKPHHHPISLPPNLRVFSHSSLCLPSELFLAGLLADKVEPKYEVPSFNAYL
jgi:hypothetical protein